MFFVWDMEVVCVFVKDEVYLEDLVVVLFVFRGFMVFWYWGLIVDIEV